MPYTPPSPSPNASYSQSRTSSRSSSFSEIASPPESALVASNRPQPTRSTSYLQKHRRSICGTRSSDGGKSFVMTPPAGISSSGPILHPPRSTSGSSIRQIQTVPMMSTGVVISPPDSSQNSSDDESENHLKRGRQVVDVAELEAAIRNSIPQRRSASPVPMMDSEKAVETFAEPRSPEILSARIHQKISHVRSSSETSATRDMSRQLQLQPQPNQQQHIPLQEPEAERDSKESSPDIEDDAYRIAPPMVRKKSGELVKSSLKSPNLKRRPSSMPSTPTYPKVVHFDAHLEHVRHFLHSERPTAVSAGSSPVESAIDNESEYPFPTTDQPPFEWEIALPNFPDRLDRSSWVVRVEKVVLSHDKKSLLGTVAVANISFQKLVVARFTLDYWQTTSEVTAEFTNDIRRKQQEDGYDRFTFKIKLEDMANLENKILFFCVRYRVNEQEFWDNNSSINYQVDFKKKPVPQNGKAGPSSAASRPLPRSRAGNTSSTRPRSMPIFDDSFDAYDLKTQPEYKMFANSTERQRDQRSSTKAANKVTTFTDPETLARRSNPSGNAFGNRYDFGASLAAAMATANKVLGPERSGIQLKIDTTDDKSSSPNPYFHGLSVSTGLPRSHSSPSLMASYPQDKPVPRVQIETVAQVAKPSLEALKKLGTEGKPSIESTSYKEILENFCFFGSAKPSPQLASGGSMPAPAFAPGSEDKNTLSVTTSTASGSRSPSPNGLAPQGFDGSQTFSFESPVVSPHGSQRGSRSPSPSHSAYGFSNGNAFRLRGPSVIQT